MKSIIFISIWSSFTFKNQFKGWKVFNSKFIDITAKGNNQKYFIHLRTTGTILPWQYYQIDFNVKNEFQVFRLPIETFKRSSSFLSNKINPKKITSIGIVAFGRNHFADIFIKEVNFVN